MERCALWSISIILIITSLRDGLCLQPLEFISVKHKLNKFSKSSLILSEFFGCSTNLEGAYIVNPYDIDIVSKKILMASISLSSEKELRMYQSLEYVI